VVSVLDRIQFPLLKGLSVSSRAISRRNYFHTVGWVVPGHFRFENCVIYRYMKTKVEITKHPVRLQGVGG